MQIAEIRHDSVLVLAPAGRVDSTNSSSLEQALSRAVDAGERRMVVDFASVDYISSAGLRALLVTARRVEQARGSWVLCALTEPVRLVFDLAGFLPLFAVESTRAAAVARLAQAR